MSNFVLVHGAWQGSWAWDQVIKEMEAARESREWRVLAPDLPGHGQRFADEVRRIGMDRYVHAVATATKVNRLEEVVLVGHGFAGTFLPQAALVLGDVVKQVVFIAGDLPPEGKRAYDRLPSRDKVMLRLLKAKEKGFKFPDFIFKRVLCDGLDPTSVRRILSRLVPEPLLPWQTPVSREGFVGKFPVTYVRLSRDKAIPPGLQQRYSQSLGSSQAVVEELDAGHGVLFSRPREVSELLLKYA